MKSKICKKCGLFRGCNITIQMKSHQRASKSPHCALSVIEDVTDVEMRDKRVNIVFHIHGRLRMIIKAAWLSLEAFKHNMTLNGLNKSISFYISLQNSACLLLIVFPFNSPLTLLCSCVLLSWSPALHH